MNIKLEDFIGELLTNWEAGFHWGLKITIDCDMRNNPDYWEFYIVGNGAVLASDVHQGHFDSLVAEVVGKAYSAAIATKNGGQFGYKPGVLHFDDWVSNSMDADPALDAFLDGRKKRDDRPGFRAVDKSPTNEEPRVQGENLPDPGEDRLQEHGKGPPGGNRIQQEPAGRREVPPIPVQMWEGPSHDTWMIFVTYKY